MFEEAIGRKAATLGLSEESKKNESSFITFSLEKEVKIIIIFTIWEIIRYYTRELKTVQTFVITDNTEASLLGL
jgi:chemotaxis signal transduction protein